MLATTGQSRLIAPEEVAEAVLALCGDRASEINGRTQVLEGVVGERGFEIVNPEELGAPKGWSNGVLAPRGGRLLFVAGQTGWDGERAGAAPAFVEQFARALDNVLAVVREAGGAPDRHRRASPCTSPTSPPTAPAARRWARCGASASARYYPAMALVEVQRAGRPRRAGRDRGHRRRSAGSR